MSASRLFVISTLAERGPTHGHQIRQQAQKQGMLTLRQDGFRKVLLGTTTVDEVARVTAGDVI